MLYTLIALVVITIGGLIAYKALSILLRGSWIMGWLRGMFGLILLTVALAVGLIAYDIFRYKQIMQEQVIATINFEKIEDQHFDAVLVVQWHLDHQFCGRCGRPTVSNDDERAKVCHQCEIHFYPRLSPCVIVLITRGDECLLAQHARSKQAIYTALAGFVEAGERLEDTIHREILEEVGVAVHSPRYFHSQPWPFPHQLMLGFHAEYASGDIQIDNDEIVDARWWRYDQLPQVPPIATLAGQLIAHFVQQQTNQK